jgi:glycosyltransferase involved in cell wall biosynthesis
MEISVLVIARDEAGRITACLNALAQQSVPPAEVIVVDDHSRDGTAAEVESFRDPRVRLLRPPGEMGLGALRNLALAASRGEAVFFTDADCRPHRHWLAEGLRSLQEKGNAGVQGLTFYESQDPVGPGESDTHQFVAGEFMTCNVAYWRRELERAGGFDPAFLSGHEDRDLALRVKAEAPIAFNREMIVAHLRKRCTAKELWRRAERAPDMVYFLKKHGKQLPLRHGVLYPGTLLAILFPPLLLFRERIRSWRDAVMLFPFYAFAVRERLLIWKSAWRHRIFII